METEDTVEAIEEEVAKLLAETEGDKGVERTSEEVKDSETVVTEAPEPDLPKEQENEEEEFEGVEEIQDIKKGTEKDYGL